METFICVYLEDEWSVLIVKTFADNMTEARNTFIEHLVDEGYDIHECSEIRIRPLASMEEI